MTRSFLLTVFCDSSASAALFDTKSVLNMNILVKLENLVAGKEICGAFHDIIYLHIIASVSSVWIIVKILG